MTDKNNRKVIEDVLKTLEDGANGIYADSKIQTALRSLLADLEAWKDTNLRLQGENDRLAEENAELEIALDSEAEDCSHQVGRCNVFESKIAELEADLRTHKDACLKYRQKQSEYMVKVAEGKEKIAELEKLADRYKVDAAHREMENFSLNRKLSHLKHLNAQKELTEDGVEKVIEEILSSAKIHPEWLGEKFVFMQRWSIVRKILGAKKAPFTETVKFSHGKELVKYLAKSVMRYVKKGEDKEQEHYNHQMKKEADICKRCGEPDDSVKGCQCYGEK